MVTPERWKEIEGLFEQALELSVNERTAFVQKSFNGDDDLRREVESLLESKPDEPVCEIAKCGSG